MKCLFVAVALCALSSVASAEPGQQADQFAHRFALDLNGNGAYYTVTLPQAVYAASLRGDLGDLRVFNGAGEPVPYSLDAPRAAAQTPKRLRTVQWFPLPQAESSAQNAPLGVSIAADGSLHATVATPAPATRDGDVVDTGPADGQVSALLIHLRNESYQGRVSVESSDDLRNWQALTDTQLLKVSYGGSTLSQERIEVEGLKARYLRLRWPDGAPDIASVEVEAQAADANAQDSTATQRQWRAGVDMQAGKAPGEYLFETDGAYPVDRLRLDLPQPNTVARATVYSRANAQTPWRDVADGVLYRLRGKTGDQGNPPFEVSADTDREWRIVVDMRNGGLGSGVPAATVGWHPDDITFVARGAAPFTLGVGNVTLTSAAASRDELLIGASPDVVAARVGAALPVSAQDVQAAATTKDNDAVRRYVLWAALLLAVGALGTMAWRLALKS
jgi:Protein of unknown function (DUF3999)